MVYKGKSLINSDGFELKSIVSQVSILQNNGVRKSEESEF